MESFELKAPIRDQLKAILADYPGGQLISEALQNAEDSAARSFELTLDLRRHDVDETRLAGPAFVLSDDGRWVVVRAPRTNLYPLTLALAHSNTVTDIVSLLFLSSPHARRLADHWIPPISNQPVDIYPPTASYFQCHIEFTHPILVATCLYRPMHLLVINLPAHKITHPCHSTNDKGFWQNGVDEPAEPAQERKEEFSS